MKAKKFIKKFDRLLAEFRAEVVKEVKHLSLPPDRDILQLFEDRIHLNFILLSGNQDVRTKGSLDFTPSTEAAKGEAPQVPTPMPAEPVDIRLPIGCMLLRTASIPSSEQWVVCYNLNRRGHRLGEIQSFTPNDGSPSKFLFQYSNQEPCSIAYPSMQKAVDALLHEHATKGSTCAPFYYLDGK